MARITDSLLIRGRRIKNRIAMLPVMTFSFHGDNGDFYGNQHVEHYTEAARGGTGLVILQATNVVGALSETEKWTPGCQSALRTIASNVKSFGAVAMMQLSCRSGIDALDVNRPSTDEIKELRSEMLEAAKKANVLGFDGVEYHFAHGFFLSRLLDSEANKRTDEFGGSLPKRASILTDIIPEIRAATGDGFIVAVRMGAYTPTEEEGIAAARHFESSGVDLLDITFGVEEPEGPVPEGFPFSPVTYSGCIIKRAVNVPVIGVFGLRSADDAKLLLEREYADIAGIGRGMLADPHFAERVIKGEPVNTCRTCRRCLWFTDHTKCPARADAR